MKHPHQGGAEYGRGNSTLLLTRRRPIDVQARRETPEEEKFRHQQYGEIHAQRLRCLHHRRARFVRSMRVGHNSILGE